jgi:hypothetical protein
VVTSTPLVPVLIQMSPVRIPVTGRGGPLGSETSRLLHSIDTLLADGGKVVSLTRLPPSTPQEYSWYFFLLEAESTPGP